MRPELQRARGLREHLPDRRVARARTQPFAQARPRVCGASARTRARAAGARRRPDRARALGPAAAAGVEGRRPDPGQGPLAGLGVLPER